MMNRIICKVLIVHALVVTTRVCQAQESVKNADCNSKVEIQYDKVTKADKRSNLIEKSKGKSFVVKFMNEFKDSIQVYVNNKLEFSDYVNSDNVTGDSNKGLGYDYSSGSGKVSLKFHSRSKDICCLVELNEKYKIIYVFIDKAGKWIIRFSNVHYIH